MSGTLFKRAYTRGINDELIRLGYVRYPTKLAADEIADAVGDQMPVEPAAEAVSPETAAEVAATLVDAANTLVSETQGAGMAPEGALPQAEEAALKTSAAEDLDYRAEKQAAAVMIKAAEETKHAMGSTIEGGDKGNLLSQSVQGETIMENKNRPQGLYNKGVAGVGQTDSPAGRGTGVVGKEEVPAPKAPGESPAGSNSVIEQSKMGSALRQVIQKIAMGTTIEGGDKGNTLSQAAGVTGEAKLENDRRPEGYAENSRGTTELPVTPAATVGTEQPHPDQPGESPAGAVPGGSGNSVVEFSNEAKTGGADPFLALFKHTAEKIGSHLPRALSEEQKIAHIRQMMGMTDIERSDYIGLLHKEAGATDTQVLDAVKSAAYSMREHRDRYQGNTSRKDRRRANVKTAEGMPPALAEAIAKKNGEKEPDDADDKNETPAQEAKEEKAEAKGKGEAEAESEKEGMDLLARIRRISQSASA